MDLHQENAGYLDLVAVAATCVAESGEQHLVHFSRTGRVILRAAHLYTQVYGKHVIPIWMRV